MAGLKALLPLRVGLGGVAVSVRPRAGESEAGQVSVVTAL